MTLRIVGDLDHLKTRRARIEQSLADRARAAAKETHPAAAVRNRKPKAAR